MAAASMKRLFPGVGRMSQLVMDRGQGAHVFTPEGKKILDFTSGIGVTNTGHCHPRVVAAVQAQAAKISHAQVNIGYHPPMLELADKLVDVTPDGLDSIFFCSTGSEGVENAVKLARHHTKKPNIVVFQGGYHGRTIGAMSLTTSKTVYRAGFGPLMPGVSVAPYPYRGGCNPSCTPGGSDCFCMEQLEVLFKQQTSPSETAAVLIEPVLGEGGYVPLPDGFLRQVQDFCTANDVLLISDEVQSGFGRTGEWFATDGHYGVSPDILVMAKGLASGYPLAAVATRAKISASQPPGSMGGTYAGNAVACAAASETIEVIRDEGLLENTRQRGAQLVRGLERLAGRFPIKDIRGKGLMIGLEFDEGVAPGTASAVSNACLERDMLLLTTSAFEVIRFVPALVVTESEVDECLDIVEAAMTQVFA